MTTSNDTLAKELAFYHKYHKNPINQFIHFFGIPAIVWSVLVWLSAFPPLNTVALVGYSLHYLSFDFVIGIITNLVLLALWFNAKFFYLTDGSCVYALKINILSWIAQFIGHGIFERNRPALMDSIVQAFLMAPIFVTTEILFLLGYKQKLHKNMMSYERIRKVQHNFH